MLFDRNGERCGAIEVIRDVTEEKRIAQALQDSERKHRTLFETAGDAILLMRDGKFIDCNAKTFALYGCSREQILGATPLDFSHYRQPDGQRSDESALEKMNQAIMGNPQLFEWEHCRWDKTPFNAEVSLNRLDLGGEMLLQAIVRDITERKRVEEAFRRGEATLRSVLRAAPIGIGILKKRIQTNVNAYWCETFGYTEDQILGQSTLMLYESEEEWNRVGQELYRDLADKGMASAETRMRCRDGSLREVILTAAPIQQDDPSAGVVGIIYDISERKKAENALCESEQKYRELVESANSIILRLNAEGQITFLNEYGLRFFGYTPEEILGLHAVGTITPPKESSGRDLDALIERICTSPKENEQSINENIRRNGKRVWVSWSNRIKHDANGKVVDILCVGTDITARKKAEDALRGREEQFRLIMENLSDLVAVLDLSGNLIYSSPSYKKILGKPEDLLGTSFFEYIHPDDAARMRQAFQKTIHTGAEYRLNFRLIDQHGNARHIESQGNVIRKPQGNMFQVAVVSRDVTERQQTEEAIRELNASLERRVAERTEELALAKERAESADRLKSAFLAAMSHELRTPLNSIIGFTGIVLQGLPGPLNPEQSKQLGMVQNSARHLLALINDVLDLSKIEAGQLEVEAKRFNARESIEKVVRLVMPLAEKKGLALISDVSPETGEIVSDPRRFEQILINLINNGVKFTENGHVRIACAVNGEMLETQVIDTGMGIKPEDMHKLFQAFQQIDAGLSRNHEGTGLGLSICKRLIEKLGGKIWVESTWGVGSVFAFSIPMSPDEEKS